MSTEENKALHRRFWEKVFNQKKCGVLEASCYSWEPSLVFSSQVDGWRSPYLAGTRVRYVHTDWPRRGRIIMRASQ